MEFETWRDEKGKSPVESFFDTLNEKDLAVLFEKIEHYEKLGTQELRKQKLLKKIHGSKVDIEELKFKLRTPCRILCVIKKEKCIAVHAFVKKYNESIRPKEIQIAKNRISQII